MSQALINNLIDDCRTHEGATVRTARAFLERERFAWGQQACRATSVALAEGIGLYTAALVLQSREAQDGGPLQYAGDMVAQALIRSACTFWLALAFDDYDGEAVHGAAAQVDRYGHRPPGLLPQTRETEAWILFFERLEHHEHHTGGRGTSRLFCSTMTEDESNDARRQVYAWVRSWLESWWRSTVQP